MARTQAQGDPHPHHHHHPPVAPAAGLGAPPASAPKDPSGQHHGGHDHEIGPAGVGALAKSI